MEVPTVKCFLGAIPVVGISKFWGIPAGCPRMETPYNLATKTSAPHVKRDF